VMEMILWQKWRKRLILIPHCILNMACDILMAHTHFYFPSLSL
jgi:hypothetical protein